MNTRVIIWIILAKLLFLPRFSIAQSINIDSCITVLKSIKDDTNKVILLDKIAWNIAYSNLQEGLDYSIRSYELAKQLSFEKYYPRICNTLGSIYVDMAEFPKALDISFEGVGYAKKYNLYGSEVTIYNTLGNTYNKQEEFAKALYYYLESVKIINKHPEIKALPVIYLNIANIYAVYEKLDSALIYANWSLDYNLKHNNRNWLASNYITLSGIYHDFGNKKMALSTASEGLLISKEVGDDYTLAHAHIQLAKAMHLNDDTQGAIKMLLVAKSYALKTGDVSALGDCAEYLSEYYQELGDFKSGLLFFKEATSYKDSSLNEESIKQIKNAEAKFENEKKQKEIELLGEKQKLNEAENHKKKLYLSAALFGILILAFVLGLVYRNNRLKEKTNNKLESFNREIQSQKELVEIKNKEITDSINYAKRIQQSILTSDNYFKKHTTDFFILFKPKDIVSGDFYWALNHEHKFIVMTADCTGHGVPGAMMSMMGINFLNEIVNEKEISNPAAILNQMRSDIIKALNPEGSLIETKDGMDCCLCSFDFKEMKLTYSNANNNFYVIRDKELIVSKSNKMPVGAGHNADVLFDEFEIDIQKGDLVISLTDGYADQFGGQKGKKFKYKQLEELLFSNAHLSLQEIKSKLDETIEYWKGDLEQVDDICIIGIKV
jgi:serine phosphatase RsbU (regulator of sigma subunit)/tetratricopeptide (TPR) repeat protein